MKVQLCRWLLLFCLYLDRRIAARLFGFGTSTSYNGTSKNFQIYWNVPTFMCHKFGMDFRQVSKKFGIIQNDKDKFRGNKIAILYDPGDFPALLKDNKDIVMQRNGGVPQEGNLTLHLDYFRHHLNEQIPCSNFSGIGVIDFESWRPIFRQNWATLQGYRDLSLEIERRRHPFWDSKAILREATERFEKFGKLFMQKTLEMAKQLRPNAEWGYYAYPYCYNLKPNQENDNCDQKLVEENDKMTWLFENTQIFLPSVYLQQKLSTNHKVNMAINKVQEAIRLSKKIQNKEDIKIFVYYWYKYQDQRDHFVEKRDMINIIGQIERLGADGVIIWGSSNDLNSKNKCKSFENYLQQILGPVVLRTQYYDNV